MFDYITYQSAHGVGYRVLQDGRVVIDQPYAPGAAGFVGMTQAEAEAFALADIAAMTPVAE